MGTVERIEYTNGEISSGKPRTSGPSELTKTSLKFQKNDGSKYPLLNIGSNGCFLGSTTNVLVADPMVIESTPPESEVQLSEKMSTMYFLVSAMVGVLVTDTMADVCVIPAMTDVHLGGPRGNWNHTCLRLTEPHWDQLRIRWGTGFVQR